MKIKGCMISSYIKRTQRTQCVLASWVGAICGYLHYPLSPNPFTNSLPDSGNWAESPFINVGQGVGFLPAVVSMCPPKSRYGKFNLECTQCTVLESDAYDRRLSLEGKETQQCGEWVLLEGQVWPPSILIYTVLLSCICHRIR